MNPGQEVSLNQLQKEETKEEQVQKQKRKAREYSLKLMERRSRWGIPDSREYKEVKNALKGLQDIMEQKPDAGNVFTFHKAHERLGFACEYYIFQKDGAVTKRGQRRLNLVEAVLKLQKLEAANMDHLRSKEHYSGAAAGGEASWEAYLGTIRKKRADVKESEVTYHGKGMSQRLEVKLGEDSVFFTKERLAEGIDSHVMEFAREIPNPVFKEVFKREQDRLKRASADNREFIQEFTLRADLYLNTMAKRESREGALKKAFNKTLESRPQNFSDGFLAAMQSPENLETFLTFTKIYKQRYLEETSLLAINEPVGANLLNRNIATRRMAELLGIPNLVVKAGPMELTVDGVRHQGIYMDEAQGIDINRPGGRERLAEAVNNGNPSFQKALSGLQVLDALCGQVDRHMGNMFYCVQNQDGREVLTGVQGIDNDLSFGRECEMSENKKHCLDKKAKIQFKSKRGSAHEIAAIDKGVGANVMMLDRELLNYTFGDILDIQEIDYLQKRVDKMKQIISKKAREKQILGQDCEWTEDVAKKAEEYGFGNYYSSFVGYHNRLKEKFVLQSEGTVYTIHLPEVEKPEADRLKPPVPPRKKKGMSI